MPSTPAERTRLDELNDLRFVASDPRGRATLWRIIESSRVYHSCPTLDLGNLAYWEGARLAGLRLLADLKEACPEKIPIMEQEAKKRAKIRTQE